MLETGRDRIAADAAPIESSSPAAMGPVVPLRRQYLEIKRRFPDVILLFRLGDFYETFDEDARIAAEVLDIVLTGREMGKGLRVPMAGIPHHAADGYVARLIAAGHKVAMCEQIGDVQKGRGLVARDVTRVITPGTVLDPAILNADRNNYIVAIALDGNRAGLAYADITTGEFATTELMTGTAEETLLAIGRELLRLGPAEVVLATGMADDAPLPRSSWLPDGLSQSQTDAWRWRLNRATDHLRRHFAVESLDGFGCAGKPLAIRAAGGLLDYLAETQRSDLRQVTSLATYMVDNYMTLDAQTRRNLELLESSRGERKHSLVAVLDQTRTPLGARLLRRWLGQPLLDLAALRKRQEAVARFHGDALARSTLRRELSAVGDLERLVNRAVTRIATPRDLGELRASLAQLPAIAAAAPDTPGAPGLNPALATVTEIHALLTAAIVDEPPAVLGKAAAIRPGYAAELDGHRARAREARDWIANLERQERERSGIKSLKVGYNKVFGYYLEITAAALASARPRDGAAALPDDYIAKQSLANATRYFTPQLKEYEAVVLTAQETLAGLEHDVFHRVMGQVADRAPRLLAAASAVAYLDLVSTLAEVAVVRDYVRPELDESGSIAIDDGRHPTLEALIGRAEYVPNDAALDVDGAQITIVTGPNMAGKSSYLRQVALIVLLAQIGSYVPARRARIGLVDRVFTRIGAQDDITTGQSTFMVEMLETANILNHATGRSLVILDEIGRGTSTYDGLAIARAIVEHLHNAPRLGCRTLFATHYHELTELEAVLPRVRCCRMDVLEDGDRVVFLRRVVPGAADRSYGVHVAQLAGIPRAVVRRAQDILAELEGDTSDRGAERAIKRAAMRSDPPVTAASIQLTLFAPPNPALAELRVLDVESLSPLEAITRLFELKRLAGDGD